MINLFFVPHDHSGARTYADQLVPWLKIEPDINVTTVFFESRYHNEFFYDTDMGEIHIPPIKKKGRDLNKYSKRCVDLFFQYIEGKENVVFHLNNNAQVKLAKEARLRCKAKIIYTLHFLVDYHSWLAYNNKWDMKLTTVGDVLEREMIEIADRIITVTKFANQAIVNTLKVPEHKAVAIHNGFSPKLKVGNLKKFTFNQFGFASTDQIILYAGLIEDRKGVKELIEAFSIVAQKNKHAHLVIAGNGDLEGVMGKITQNWGRITFTGKIGYSLLEQLYRKAAIGVIPSIFEQCSYVALEMMYYGLPVVVNNAPGLAELYTHGINGWVIPLKKGNPEKLKLEVDVQAFATGMTELLNESSLRTKIARNSRKLWETNYSSQRMGIETINEYKNT